jgi:hypothetical protein
MNSIRRLLFDQTLTLLITAFVHSRLEYGNAVFAGHSASDIYGLQSVELCATSRPKKLVDYEIISRLLVD